MKKFRLLSWSILTMSILFLACKQEPAASPLGAWRTMSETEFAEAIAFATDTVLLGEVDRKEEIVTDNATGVSKKIITTTQNFLIENDVDDKGVIMKIRRPRLPGSQRSISSTSIGAVTCTMVCEIIAGSDPNQYCVQTGCAPNTQLLTCTSGNCSGSCTGTECKTVIRCVGSNSSGGGMQ